jgi:hypothetical protein
LIACSNNNKEGEKESGQFGVFSSQGSVIIIGESNKFKKKKQRTLPSAFPLKYLLSAL